MLQVFGTLRGGLPLFDMALYEVLSSFYFFFFILPNIGIYDFLYYRQIYLDFKCFSILRTQEIFCKAALCIFIMELISKY